ncbi:lipocalin family protein [Sporocytophaga myxococcoides]|uniref:lipocalin family protein n=1 Tax=Sporocytophaga myxococcoides TaxID=153721 RepID=UPI0003FDAA4E|nr:lipocalin family protein [Sporocytophaga myxococcoides]
MMEKEIRWGSVLGGAIAGAILGYLMRRKPAPLKVERKIDLNRYQGKWYEIAAIPTKFEKGCINATSEYSLEKDGTFRIVNECRVTESGNLKKSFGKAILKDAGTNSKFKVKFRGPFKRDYQILSVGNEYEYALAGDESRTRLWILSRKPVLSKNVVDQLIDKAKNEGFDIGKIVFIKHNHQNEPCY